MEGNESNLTEAVIGVPLAKEEPDFDAERPDRETPRAAIEDAELPPETPDSGPGTVLLLMLSLAAAGAYVLSSQGRRAHSRNF